MNGSPKALWMLLPLLAACTPPGSEPPPSDRQRLADLQGQAVTSEPYLVALDPRWNVRDDQWRFFRMAGFVLAMNAEPAEDIAIELVPAPGQALPELEFVLDGQAVPATTPEAGGEGIVAHLPRQALGVGTHLLEVTPKVPGPLAFTELSVDAGDRRQVFRPADRGYHVYLSEFLALGVASYAPPQCQGGFLMVGPQHLKVEVPAGADRFVARFHNVSLASPASVTLRSGGDRVERQVAARQEVRLELALGDRAPELELRAEGGDLALFHWSVSRFEHEGAQRRPPLVLISLDTTRRDVISPWSGERSVTPHLAALAEVADVFDSATTTAPWTLPSHASMFTGQYPSRHGAGVVTSRLGPEHDTLAARLSRQGYVTAGFGGGAFTSHRFGLGQGFNSYRGPVDKETAADRLTDAALGFLDEHGEDPFFLFVNYFDPHFPFQAPPRFESPALQEARRTGAGNDHLKRLLAGRGGAWNDLKQAGQLDAAVELVFEAYRAEVAFMDEQIGRLFDALAAEDLFDPAWIVVVSDHGESLGEGGFFNHSRRLSPELIRIPMIVKHPGQKRGRRIAAPVSVIDVFPTLLAAAGIETAAGDAVVLDPAVLAASRRRAVHSEEHAQPVVHPLTNHTGPHHLLSIEGSDQRQVLTPGEVRCQRREDGVWRDHPCASSGGSGYAELGRRLAGGAIASSQPGTLTEQQEERLRALGYLD